MAHSHDVIIIGRGIAGVVLSETLRAMGKRVVVFDVPKENAASPAAAGIVNPVVLRRTTLSWRATEMLGAAERFYRALERDYDCTFWHPLPLIKLFHNEKEASDWSLRMHDPEVGPFLTHGDVAGFDVGRFNAPHGFGIVRRCAWLDVQAMREAHRAKWFAMDALVEREVLGEEVRAVEDGVLVHGASAPLLVWCTGPFSAQPGLALTRGEVLTRYKPELKIGAMVHRGGFLLPIGNDRYKLGSTFAWEDVWSGPTQTGKEELMRKLKSLSPFLYHKGEAEGEVSSGVRPATKDRRPILGSVAPHQAVFNGLGSRGVLLAPWCALRILAHLFHGEGLDPEVDAARFME